ncbi:RNase A-like domain-containing protein [Streptomyces sp. NPDC020719]|uniref:RNase A-like domain-containing protein n=1 Tax=Streptomyces sp. NPDC020719 TaxID=3154896 RepID=UPI0033CE45E9
MATPVPQPSASASPSAGDVKPSQPNPDKTPSPSPGTSPDPNYKPPPPPPTGPDGTPSDKRREWERERLKQPKPDANGGFEVRPGHLYYASVLVRDEQFTFHKAGNQLVEDVHCRQAAGKGDGPDAFAAAYADVAKRFLEVWARSIQSIGGVAVGLTTTANHYQAADWAAAGMKHDGPAPRQDPPIGVGNTHYGPVASIKWTGTGDGTDVPFLAALGEIPDFVSWAIEPAIKQGLRLGKTYDITPGAETDDLRKIGDAWQRVGEAAKTSAHNFADIIGGITDAKNNDWQHAMNGFCQSVWGTTAWGEPRSEDGKAVPKGGTGREWRTNPDKAPGDRQPIIEILQKTGTAVHKIFHDVAKVADTTRDTTSRLGAEAGKATIKDITEDLDFEEMTRLAAGLLFAEIVMKFRSHMDKDAVDRAVDGYQKAFHEAATALKALLPELDEAFDSAPTYEAEEARAEAYGARSMDEFKQSHRWTKPGNTDLGIYDVDLASTEWLENSHTVNKHVGLTDEQLAQRLRDELKGPVKPESSWPYGQPRLANASTFKDLGAAQRVTQYNIDQNKQAISEWIAKHPDKGAPLEFTSDQTPYGVNGRSIDRQEMRNSPNPVDKAEDTYGVKTKLVYNPDLDPPFTVMTSMPIVGKKP